MNDIAKRIRELRETLGYTQQEFADCLGIKRNTVATYEGGRTNPIDSAISLICREFYVSEEWLRNGTGEMFYPRSDDTLDKLTREYHLSSYGRAILEKYLSLPPDQRAVIESFVASFADSTKSDPVPSWIDLEVEDYRRELEQQEKTGSRASDTIVDTPA